MAKTKKIKFDYRSALSDMTVGWQSCFLFPFWAQVAILPIGALLQNEEPVRKIAVLVFLMSLAFIKFLAEIKSRQIIIGDKYLEFGLRRYEIADLKQIVLPPGVLGLPGQQIRLYFNKDGVEKSFSLSLMILKPEDTERLLEILNRRVSGLVIDSQIEGRLKSLKPLVVDRIPDPNELVLPYRLFGFAKDLPETLKSTYRYWTNEVGPIGTFIVMTPLWLASSMTLFTLLHDYEDTVKNQQFYAFLASCLRFLDTYPQMIWQTFNSSQLLFASAIGVVGIMVIWVLAVFFLFLALKIMISPNRLTINREGIELDFWTDIMSTETDRVNFSDVERVELVGASDSANPEKLEILVTTKPRETPLGPLASVLTLKLSAIRKADREKFLKALEEFAPARATSSEVVEALKVGAENSYTELWLQSLNESSIRKNIQPLCEGDLLQDGRYQIVRRLGIGGEGTAYEAFDRSNLAHGKVERIVLKETIMPPYTDRPQEQESLSRIKKESEILSSLNSPLVVACHGFFLEDRRSYLVLEYIEGENLRELVRKQVVKQQGAIKQEQVIELALIMCDILMVLHDKQIIHRDFTPDNLIYKADSTDKADKTEDSSVGQLKLIDFAVATEDKGGTTGTIVGKHSYVPPEQFRGHAQYRSDIYSMAATMYYLLTGQDPEPITQAKLDHRKDLCPALVELIEAATSQNPEERPESARQFKEMLLNIKTQIANENLNSTSEVDQEPLTIKLGEREKEELRWQNSA